MVNKMKSPRRLIALAIFAIVAMSAFGFAAAAPDGAEEGTVLADDHLGAGLAGGAAAGAGYGGEDDGLSAFNGGEDFAIDLVLHVVQG